MDLRNEIVEHEKARLDLYKWKLILVAALGGAASGLYTPTPQPQLIYLLALIPWVCTYVDLLAKDQLLKMIVIARYLYLLHLTPNKKESNPEYERFVEQAARLPSSSLRDHVCSIRSDAAKWLRRSGVFLLRARGSSEGHLAATRNKAPMSAYAFEHWAQHWSTVVLTLGVIVWPWLLKVKTPTELALFFLSSVLALIATLLMRWAYDRRCTHIFELPLPSEIVFGSK